MITENSIIEFHKLRFSNRTDEHGLYSIVRWDTDDSFKIDHNVIIALQLLSYGKTIKEASDAIKFTPDVIITVLNMMEKSHFFKSIDQVPVEDAGEKINPWLTNIDRKWFDWVMNSILLKIILFFILTGILIGILTFGIPSYKAFFWSPDLFTVFVSLFFVGLFLTALHEFSHFVTTKAVGGEATMRLNYRYIFLVCETECYHLAVIPKKMRYCIYFAGIIIDLIVVAASYWFIIFTKLFNIHIGLLGNFLIAVIIMQFIGIIWEFNVFLETDMYNFLCEYLGIDFLRNDAIRYLSNHVQKLKIFTSGPIAKLFKFFSDDEYSDRDDLRFLSKRGKRKLQLYIVILILGIVFVTLQYIFYSIPRDLSFVYQGILNLRKAISTNDIVFALKSIAIIILVSYEYILIIYLKYKSVKKIKK